MPDLRRCVCIFDGGIPYDECDYHAEQSRRIVAMATDLERYQKAALEGFRRIERAEDLIDEVRAFYDIQHRDVAPGFTWDDWLRRAGQLIDGPNTPESKPSRGANADE